jgi:hypothetical protein
VSSSDLYTVPKFPPGCLAPEQLKWLDEASRIELGLPYDFYSEDMIRDLTSGGLVDRLDV